MTASFDLLNKTWFAPTFSILLANRNESLVIVGAGALQIGLHLAGLPGWACPFKNLFGIPCPGCGLTAATGQLLHGQWQVSLQTHAFASLFVFSFFIMAIAILLPQKQRHSMTTWIAGFERRTGITSLFLAALMFYWVIRLAGLA
jgi:hypothetical protein